MRLIAVTTGHAPPLAELHAAGFTPAWSANDIAELLASPGAFGLAAEDESGFTGFVLARTVADESEILTIAVDPAQRRQGLGRGAPRSGNRDRRWKRGEGAVSRG